eukprot:scaffold169706_cov15-Tisochrysis_lutea.AAC.3
MTLPSFLHPYLTMPAATGHQLFFGVCPADRLANQAGISFCLCNTVVAAQRQAKDVLQQLDQEGCIRVADLLRELPLSSVFVVGQAHSFVTEGCSKTPLAAGITLMSGGGSVILENFWHACMQSPTFKAFEKMDTVVKKDGYSTISITP